MPPKTRLYLGTRSAVAAPRDAVHLAEIERACPLFLSATLGFPPNLLTIHFVYVCPCLADAVVSLVHVS